MSINPALYSARKEDWPTPWELFKQINERFAFTLDPCATEANAKCQKFFTQEQDGLIQDWGKEVVFMNPPYGRNIKAWMHKAKISAEAGATVVCLVHARTDTRWWHDEVEFDAAEIQFLKGRVRFEGAPSSSPFPSVLVIYLPPDSAYQPIGWVHS